ncbi:MAG: HD domain-containing protein [Candidatus Delongbacteria bacterium]|nr:HD domain-containing protein [Candidatus Delongbacteria bacterium]
MASERLIQQLSFIKEVELLKGVFRQTSVLKGGRRENDAEHSWHLALMIIVLSEYADQDQLDILKALKMVVIHDLVEIDAGDTFAYDHAGEATKPDRERLAADRIFGLLPVDQATGLRTLWDEFEARKTVTARFAAAVDRLQPMLSNFADGGGAWRRHGITSQQVAARNHQIVDGAPALWEYAEQLIREAVEQGYLPE